MARGEWKYSVYVAVNNISGRHYVGMTSQTVAVRWERHRKAALKGADQGLCRGIRKHGAEAFSVREVARSRTKEDAFHVEQALIAEYRLGGIPLYNMTAGGEGVVDLNDAGKEKKRQAITEKWKDPEVREKMLAAKNASMTAEAKERQRAGILRSWADPEIRARRIAAMVGHKVSAETAKKIGDAQRGRKLSEESRAKISAGLKGVRKGVKFTDEHRKAISEARKGLKFTPEQLEKRRQGIAERRASKGQV